MSSPTNPLVVKANALIEAQYRLTVLEQRILLACISQLKRDELITHEVMYSVSAADIAGRSGMSEGSAYRDLAEAARRLKRREVWAYDLPNGGGRLKKPLQMAWVQTVAYAEKEGRVELRFNQDVLPYLNLLTREFTQYALSDVAGMSSAYAIRLYELLVQWGQKGCRTIEIEWLREALQMGGKYPLYADFRKWVVEPSIQQINAHSPLKVAAWEPVKTGRKVTHLTIHFRPKVSRKKLAARLTRAFIEKHAKPGETYEEAEARLRREGH